MRSQLASYLTEFYRYLPDCLALQLARSVRALVGLRDYGAVYLATRQLIKQTEYHSREQLAALQLAQLKEIVAHAWSLCPGYRSHWQQHGFEPCQLRTLADLQRIPPVSKALLHDNSEEFSIPSAGQRRKRITTSGSGGMPLAVYYDRQSEAKESAFLHDLWRRRGFQRGMQTLVIRGSAVRGGYQSCPYAEISLYGDLLLSAYHISPATIQAYADQINDFNPVCIQAYPSALAQVSRLCQSWQVAVRTPALACVILASEKLYEQDAKVIQSVFPAPIIHFYGMTELAALGGPCETSDEFHLYPQYGITEVITSKGVPAQQGEFGELVGTSFLMRQTPIIRYQTGDLVQKGADICSSCGRQYPLISEVIGRSNEFIITADEEEVPFSMAIGSIHDDTFSGLTRFQFVQERAGELIFCYEAAQQWPDTRLRQLEAQLQQKVGRRLSLFGRRLRRIEPGANGKHSFFKRLCAR